MVPSMVNDIYIIRFAVCAKYANDEDMHVAFNIIQEHADSVLAEYRAQRSTRQSSSNDSLDLITKQGANTNSTEYEAPVSTEAVSPEIVPETPAAPIIHPTTKPRVKRTNDSVEKTCALILGSYNNGSVTTPSCYIRKTHIELS